MVGGRDYTHSEFNRATQAQRAPGSAFKPFVFLAALQKGWEPTTQILDAPITEGTYRPKNFADKYYGDVSVAFALANSLNTATLRIAQSVGVKAIISTAKDLGIISKMQSDLSIALGSSGISMMEMVTAYSIIANGGTRVYPYAITRITNSEGRVLYERKPPKSYHRAIDTRHAKALSQMMRGVIDFGTGQRAKLPVPASGKTGTSQESRDAWFVGFSEQAAAAVWLGNDDNSPMKNVTGGSFPAQIWRDVMADIPARYNSANYQTYDLPSMTPASGSESESSSDSSGFSNLMGRLLKGASSGAKQSDGKSDYSNLNN
jgi:penicillin-binding protein 1A